MKYLFLINPKSGDGAGFRLAKTIYNHINHQDFELIILKSFSKERLTQKFLEDFDYIIVAGGDGTFSSIANHIIKIKSDKPIAVFPLGTGNDIARALGTYDLGKTIINNITLGLFLEQIATGSQHCLDVWKLGRGHFFTNCCSFGLDALVSYKFDVARNRHKIAKNRFTNVLIYSYFGFTNLNHKIKPPFYLQYIDANDKMQEKLYDNPQTCFIISNLPTYGAGAIISEKSDPCDNLLEFTPVDSGPKLIELFMSRHWNRRSKLKYFKLDTQQAKALTISGIKEHYLQVDGEDRSKLKVPLRKIEITHAGKINVIRVKKRLI